jgi:predicted XRE-type DNA-binding protein
LIGKRLRVVLARKVLDTISERVSFTACIPGWGTEGEMRAATKAGIPAEREAGAGGPSHVTTGSVLDDLGFSADEALDLKIKVRIWRALIAHVEGQGFGTEQLVRTLKVHQPDVSNLLNGKIGRFSVSRLIQFASRLNLSAEVRIVPAEPEVLRVIGEESKRNGRTG